MSRSLQLCNMWPNRSPKMKADALATHTFKKNWATIQYHSSLVSSRKGLSISSEETHGYLKFPRKWCFYICEYFLSPPLTLGCGRQLLWRPAGKQLSCFPLNAILQLSENTDLPKLLWGQFVPINSCINEKWCYFSKKWLMISEDMFLLSILVPSGFGIWVWVNITSLGVQMTSTGTSCTRSFSTGMSSTSCLSWTENLKQFSRHKM